MDSFRSLPDTTSGKFGAKDSTDSRIPLCVGLLWLFFEAHICEALDESVVVNDFYPVRRLRLIRHIQQLPQVPHHWNAITNNQYSPIRIQSFQKFGPTSEQHTF